MAKSNYNYDEAKALPTTFERDPPQDCEGDMEHPAVLEANGKLRVDAIRSGGILANLSKKDIDLIYANLAPLTKKLQWYQRRYNNMQSKIDYLKDTNNSLVQENQKLRRMVSTLGGKIS